MHKWNWTIGLVCSCMIALSVGRAEARDIRIKGDWAGTGLTTRIDLDNDGGLADWATWVEKSNLGQSSAQAVIEGSAPVPPTGACPADQLETALVGGSIVNTFLHTRDQLFIQPTSRVLCFDPATGAFSAQTLATITNGTGKFAGATGSLDYRWSGLTLLPDFGPPSNQGFFSFTGTVEGTLTLP